MRRIGQNLQNNVLAIKISLMSIAKMILDVTCKLILVEITLFGFFQEFLENLLSWLLEDTVKGVESSSVSHSDDDVLHT